MSQHAQHQGTPEWTAAMIISSISHTCAFPAVTRQNICCVRRLAVEWQNRQFSDCEDAQFKGASHVENSVITFN